MNSHPIGNFLKRTSIMIVMPRARVVAAALLWLAAAALAQAQPAAKEYEPKPYQEGKDVVWLPTPQAVVNKMLDLAKVTARDTVIDLGSGDGRTVITAATRGARALIVNPTWSNTAPRRGRRASPARSGS